MELTEKYLETYVQDAVSLLKKLIATPSVSRNEAQAADILEAEMTRLGLNPQRDGNNVWSVSNAECRMQNAELAGVDGRDGDSPDSALCTLHSALLLNAHIDTVKPVASWTRNPFEPTLEGDRLYGLGSNDCGGGLVTLLQVFRWLKEQPRTFNVIFLASAEEEVSGKNGVEHVLPLLPKIDVAIVGEPTGMQPAIAEKGLMVLDLIAHGRSGHAARREGENALYKILDDLCWIRDYQFEKVSPLLGPTLMNATVIHAGTQHNVVPDRCEALVDVRTNELYTNEEVLEIIRSHVRSEVVPHSTRLQPSRIAEDHPLVRRCCELGLQPFGSPTLSDQALMPFPSLKLGPGQSSRSHSADEYICVSEIRQALSLYTRLLDPACQPVRE